APSPPSQPLSAHLTSPATSSREPSPRAKRPSRPASRGETANVFLGSFDVSRLQQPPLLCTLFLPPFLLPSPPPVSPSHLPYNFLTGPIPPITAPLNSFDVTNNLLSGTFPPRKTPIKACLAAGNCLGDASACAVGAGQQRADMGDAYCEAVVGDLCRPAPEAGETWQDQVALRCSSRELRLMASVMSATDSMEPFVNEPEPPLDAPEEAEQTKGPEESPLHCTLPCLTVPLSTPSHPFPYQRASSPPPIQWNLS
ncbi:unnamed protein product, partial [Closterium sp. Naga37s-1]